ncbi:MAG: archaeosine synthase subunit alpha [Thermoplasmatales archaeon]|nr:archaeosine synthase subunit alpha [Thermoplasmatales archaeon]
MFEIVSRDGIGRTGKLDNVNTPNILFAASERFKEFKEAKILLSSRELKSEKMKILDNGSRFYPRNLKNDFVIPPDIPYPLSCSEFFENYENDKIVVVQDIEKLDKNREVYVLSNAPELVKNPKEFVKNVVELRKKIGYSKIVYAPGIGAPNSYALLVYLGIDLFDSVSLIMNSRKKYFLTNDGKTFLEHLKENPCRCPACLDEKSDFVHLLHHNYYTALSEFKNIRNRIKNGLLRELVESRIRTEPLLVSMLRLFDKHYDFQEKYFPVRKEKMIILSKESLLRPGVKRFQSRLKERYLKPESKKILLLLPCSAKKPYSFSISHQLLKKAVFKSGNQNIVHEMIVTSPLGIVPRELELFYPAQNYDIPVTGEWDADEIKMVNEMIDWLIKNNKYDEIINHTGYSFVDAGVNTCPDKPVSQESLKKLEETLSGLVKNYAHVKREKIAVENMLNRAVFQFGSPGVDLVKGSVIKGRYPDLRIIKNNKQIGMLIGDRGMISLTIKGGKILADKRKYFVEIDDFKLKGDVFAVGVLDADHDIRIGDDVIIIHKNVLKGVGVAVMSPEEMMESKRGVAVKVRHKT